jgi:hypothetical protein
MVILQALIVFALQSTNRIVTIALGWATMLLFGRVPQERQIYLSLVVFGSIVWLIVVAGIAWPPLATFLLAFVRIPRGVHYNWVRVAMLAGATIIPLLVGTATLLLRDPWLRPTDVASKWQAALSGYRFTVGIALTLIVTVGIAPALQVRNLFQRWATRHFPVVVQTADYADVVGDIERELESVGLHVHRMPTNVLLRIPTMMLTAFVGGTFDRVVASELATLASDGLEIVLHPFDLVISGHATIVMRVQAALTERLPFTKAYLTWTRDGNEIEDRIKAAWRETLTRRDGSTPLKVHAALGQIEQDLNTTNLSFEEWEVLLRVLLLTQRRVRRAAANSLEIDAPSI